MKFLLRVAGKIWDRAIENLESYDWLLFTSVNGVKYFFKRINSLGKDVRALKDIKVGAIGPKTGEAVFEKGIRPDLVPDEYRAESVVDAFRNRGADKLRILLPRAAEAREILPEELKKMGAHVDVVEAYKTILPDTGTGRIRAMLEKGEINMITFTSSSTVTNFMAMFGNEVNNVTKWLEKVDIACIGPITEKTAKENGLKVGIIPSEYTIEALTNSILEHYS